MKFTTEYCRAHMELDESSARSSDLMENLRQTCADLLNPLVHYSFERSADLVRSIVVAARKLDFNDLLAAATCSLRKMEEHDCKFSRNQCAVNMYERSRWLYSELQAALGEDVDRHTLQKRRSDLFCEPYDLAPINHSQARETGRRLAVGAFRKQLRSVRATLSTYQQVVREADPDKTLAMMRHVGGNLNGAFASMVYELECAEQRTSAKPSLHCACGAISEFWSDVRSGRAALQNT